MMPKAMSKMTAHIKNGPRKLKSAPRFAAMNVKSVSPINTTRVRLAASNTASPVG